MTDNEQAQEWSREFQELGAAKVRNSLMLNRWNKEKHAAARHWLEHLDARKFQAGISTDSPARPPKTAKRITYIAGGILLLVVVARVLPRLF
jgi:hypothetical protein